MYDGAGSPKTDIWWIDWQQGGSQGGMTGNKQVRGRMRVLPVYA